MELKLLENLKFPVNVAKPSVDIDKIENFSHFSAVRLARKYFERQGFSVYEGSDFEDNFFLYFYGSDKLFYDEYTKVKLGKSQMTEAKNAYCSDISVAIPLSDIHLLLVLCRFCSYTGDPGFPDLVLVKDGWHLVYVLFDELSLSQQMFLLFSRLIGLDVKIVKLDMEEKQEEIEIDPFILLDSVLNERRARNIMNGLGKNIAGAEAGIASGGVDKKIWEDEYEYLSSEKTKNPLFLFNLWRRQGIASASQLKGAIRFVMTHNRHDFEKYLDQLKDDPDFMSIEEKTEDAMKQRAEYMQQKFGLGRSRSKLLLNFF